MGDQLRRRRLGEVALRRPGRGVPVRPAGSCFVFAAAPDRVGRRTPVPSPSSRERSTTRTPRCSASRTGRPPVPALVGGRGVLPGDPRGRRRPDPRPQPVPDPVPDRQGVGARLDRELGDAPRTPGSVGGHQGRGRVGDGGAACRPEDHRRLAPGRRRARRAALLQHPGGAGHAPRRLWLPARSAEPRSSRPPRCPP